MTAQSITAMMIWALLASVCQGRRTFKLGSCWGYFQEKGIMPWANKVLFDEGFFNDILPYTDFDIAIGGVDALCDPEQAARLVLPQMVGTGNVEGRFYSSDTLDPVIGISGCTCSGATMAVQPLAGAYRVPQISGSSTNPTLSNKAAYPYFMRTIPPDSIQAAGFHKLCSHWGYNRVFVVHTPDGYGEGVAVAFKDLGAADGMAIFLARLPIMALADPAAAWEWDYKEYVNAANRLKYEEFPQPRVLLYSGMSPRYALRAFDDVGLMGPSFLWLAVEGACLLNDISTPDSVFNPTKAAVDAGFAAGQGEEGAEERREWWDDRAAWDRVPEAAKGLVCLLPKGVGPRLTSRFESYWATMTFDKLAAAGLPSAYTEEMVADWLDNHTNPNDVVMKVFRPPHHPYNTYSFDAMSSFIVAISEMLAENATRVDISGEALLTQLKATTFDGLTGLIGFNEDGDRLAPFTINNLVYDAGTGASDIVTVGDYDGATGAVTFVSDPVFADGTTIPPPDRSDPCPAGSSYNIDVAACALCSRGTYAPATDSRECIPCALGTAVGTEGATACKQCEAGDWSATEGASACHTCAPGHYSSAVGLTGCDVCQPGFFSTAGAHKCELCAEGSYSELSASSSCNNCTGGTTSPRASDSKSMCLCDPGSYFHTGNNSCVPCTEGLVCPRGVDMPTQQAGFYAEVLDEDARDIVVYKCSSVTRCAEGELGKCEGPYAHRNCAKCGSDSVNPNHECAGCPAGAVVVIVVVLICGLIATYFICDQTKYGQATIFFMVGGNLAIVVATVQGVYIAFSFFPELEVSPQIETLSSVFMLKFSDVQDVCGFGPSFAARLGFVSMFPVYVVVGYAALLSVGVLIRKVVNTTVKPDIEPAINATGVLFQALYVLLCKQAVSFFVGKRHLDPNAPVTLADFPDVVMGSQEHMEGVGIAVAQILIYVVGMYAFFAWSVYVAPKQASNIRFFRAFKFIFLRWRPHMWYWGMPLLLRNFGLAMVPVIVTTTAAHRVGVLCAMVMVYQAMESWYQPWLTMLNNQASAAMSVMIVLVSITGLRGPDEPADTPFDMSFLTVCYVLIWSIFACSCVCAAALSLRPQYFQRPRKLAVEKLVSTSRLLATDLPQEKAKLERLVSLFSSYDVGVMIHAMDLIEHEILGDITTKRFNIRSAYQDLVEESISIASYRAEQALKPEHAVAHGKEKKVTQPEAMVPSLPDEASSDGPATTASSDAAQTVAKLEEEVQDLKKQLQKMEAGYDMV